MTEIKTPAQVDTMLARIAAANGIETLETRNSDSLDFHDVSAASLKEMLQAAFAAGRNIGAREQRTAVYAPSEARGACGFTTERLANGDYKVVCVERGHHMIVPRTALPAGLRGTARTAAALAFAKSSPQFWSN